MYFRYMSDKIRIKKETPIKEEYLDPDIPARSEKGIFKIFIIIRFKEFKCESKRNCL